MCGTWESSGNIPLVDNKGRAPFSCFAKKIDKSTNNVRGLAALLEAAEELWHRRKDAGGADHQKPLIHLQDDRRGRDVSVVLELAKAALLMDELDEVLRPSLHPLQVDCVRAP